MRKRNRAPPRARARSGRSERSRGHVKSCKQLQQISDQDREIYSDDDDEEADEFKPDEDEDENDEDEEDEEPEEDAQDEDQEEEGTLRSSV